MILFLPVIKKNNNQKDLRSRLLQRNQNKKIYPYKKSKKNHRHNSKDVVQGDFYLFNIFLYSVYIFKCKIHVHYYYIFYKSNMPKVEAIINGN